MYGDYLPIAELGTPGGEWLSPSSASRYSLISTGETLLVAGLMEYRTIEKPQIVSFNFNQIPFDTQPLKEGFVFTLTFEEGDTLKRVSAPRLSNEKDGITFSVRNTAQSPAFSMMQPAVSLERADESLSQFGWITIDDKEGNRYAVTRGSLYGINLCDDETWFPAHAYTFAPISGEKELTVRMDYAVIHRETGIDFKFPITGLNGDAELTLDSEEFPIRITGYQYYSEEKDGHDIPTLRLFLDCDQRISYIDFYQPGSLYETQNASCGILPDGKLACDLTVETFATGTLPFAVRSFEYRVEGPWEVQWKPYALESADSDPFTEELSILSYEDDGLPKDLPQELRRFTDRLAEISAELSSSEGWVLYKTRSHLEEPPAPVPALVSSASQKMPADSIMETWYHIRNDGTVNETLTLLYDENGENLLSGTWTKAGIQVILPMGLRVSASSYAAYAIPFVYDSDFLSLIESGHLPQKIDGNTVIFRLSPMGEDSEPSENDQLLTFEFSTEKGIITSSQTAYAGTKITRETLELSHTDELPEKYRNMIERIIL